jgi:putative nucleotidyltransferase with HDIG domain
MDLVTAASLLHDVSKPLENAPDGKTKLGKLFPHAHLGAHLARQAGLSDELVHIIVTHSRNSSPMPPSTYEGLIVHYADYCDSDVLNVKYGKKILLSF